MFKLSPMMGRKNGLIGKGRSATADPLKLYKSFIFRPPVRAKARHHPTQRDQVLSGRWRGRKGACHAQGLSG
ncbi:MAG: hypothetical protein ACOVMO_12150 [Caulobacter sp.]